MALGTLRLKTIELEGEISYLTKASVPIGFTYIQFPGKSEPSVLYYGVWANVSDEYPGDFFRVEGGNALAFSTTNLTEQLDQMQRITGDLIATYLTTTAASQSLNRNGALDLEDKGYTVPGSSQVNGTLHESLTFDSFKSPDARTSTTTDGETFPVNRTFRIWKRVS